MIKPDEPFSIYIYINTHIYIYIYTYTHTHIYIYIYIYYVQLQDLQTKKHKNHYLGAAPCPRDAFRCPLEPNELLPSVQLHVTNEPCARSRRWERCLMSLENHRKMVV